MLRTTNDLARSQARPLVLSLAVYEIHGGLKTAGLNTLWNMMVLSLQWP